MSFNARLKKNAKDTGTTATTAVAAGTTIGGNSLQMDKVRAGTAIAAQVIMGVTTSSLTLTPSFQGSTDGGTTWQNLFFMNSPANVATAAGTGSLVTTSRTILTPAAPLPFTHIRGAVTTAGATAHASADTYQIRYHYLEQEF